MSYTDQRWEQLLSDLKREILERVVVKVEKIEETQQRVGRDDYYYLYYIFHLKSNQTPIKILFEEESGFCRFHCNPIKEIDKFELINSKAIREGHKWIIIIAKEAGEYELLRKFNHVFAFYETHERLNLIINRAQNEQEQIIHHLTGKSGKRLEIYSHLKKMMFGETKIAIARLYEELYMEFNDVEYGNIELIDPEKIKFSTYRNYENTLEQIKKIESVFDQYELYKQKGDLKSFKKVN